MKYQCLVCGEKFHKNADIKFEQHLLKCSYNGRQQACFRLQLLSTRSATAGSAGLAGNPLDFFFRRTHNFFSTG